MAKVFRVAKGLTMMPFTVDDVILHGLWISRIVALGSTLALGIEHLAGYAALTCLISTTVMIILSLKRESRTRPPPPFERF